jgi:HTH-type transcriptional regulator/antitoxin HigA
MKNIKIIKNDNKQMNMFAYYNYFFYLCTKIRNGSSMNGENKLLNGMVSVHPGEILQSVLEDYGMSQKELAVAIGKPSPIINDIIRKKRNINPEFAVLLEAVLPEISAADWMSMQNQFDISNLKRQEDIQQQKDLIEQWNTLKEYLNLNYMKKKLHLADDLGQSLNAIFGYLGISEVSELKAKQDSVMAYFKKSEKSSTDPINLLTWLCVVRHRSDDQKLDIVFDISQVGKLVSELNEVFYINKDVENTVTNLLNSYGIKFLVEKKLDRMAVDGVSFWSGNNPTIVMTERMNRIDNFAFVLCHELGHIVKHLYVERKSEFLDDMYGLKEDPREKEANQFAEDSLWKGFTKETAFRNIHVPFAASRFLQQIAIEQRINISIVVGQYQHYCEINNKTNSPYAICRNLIQKIG